MSITATEMMPSMVSRKRPSRAEVSDIVNAVLEGSEGLLLAEETAIGRHPVLVVETMKKIVEEAERWKRRK
jgi:pyruvate kinase